MIIKGVFMKKVAFIRSVDIHQAEPSLSLLLENIKTMKKVNDLKLKLFFSDGIIHDEKIFPGEVCRFSSDASVDKLVLEIVKWSPDYVISISIPDNNSFRDSVLKEKLKKYGIPMLIHPIDSMFILCNKWNTSLWLKSQGFYVPKSIQVSYEKIANNIGVDYSEYLNAIYCSLSQMHGPFVVKPLWDSMSCGVQIFDDCSQVVEYIKKYCKQDLIIEQHVDGELFSIEVLADENNILVQPLIKKVLLDKKDLMPFNHLRYGNYRLEDNLYFNLKSNLLRIVKKLRLNGNVEFEMIRKDNKFHIIEINPRVSGVTNLSTAISGINTYSWLLLAALNNNSLIRMFNNFLIS
ncbi:hypothetical protein CAC02_07070 [Streptococcus gallolyticus]|uniref:ATP-grasp domain-containing protein n=1 Tax=Streptococcus gallolyticus TaxID=315405 RepID=A0A368UDC5_9STRE|nr:hypothetical protein CAC02_07070 [Streptococcus gallolyticus]